MPGTFQNISQTFPNFGKPSEGLRKLFQEIPRFSILISRLVKTIIYWSFEFSGCHVTFNVYCDNLLTAINKRKLMDRMVAPS